MVVKAAFVLKSKSDESVLLFDPRRPTVSPIKRGETSGKEEGAVGNEESSQSSGVGGIATGPVVEDVLRKLRGSARLPKEKDAAALEKLAKGVKMSKEELDKEMSMPFLKAYLEWKEVPYSSKVKKAELVDMVFAATNGGYEVMGDVGKVAMKAASEDDEEAAAEEVGIEDVKAGVQAAVEVVVEEAPNAIKEATVKKAAEDAAAMKASKVAEEAAVKAAEVAAGKAVEDAAAVKKAADDDAAIKASKDAEEAAVKAAEVAAGIKAA